MHEQLRQDAKGAILFDATVSPQVDGPWFDADHWRGQGALSTQSGGRGGVAIIHTPAGECVLRHYRRGGVVARLMGDRYLWTGADRTRSFREFRLLQTMAKLQLPVPQAVAAQYRHAGLHYRADLIMRRIADTYTLADGLAQGRLDTELAREVGALVARFHRAGVWHADLNAHNVLIAPSGLYLVDFDRGRMRTPELGWRMANLQRLRRSLFKLGAAEQGEAVFDQMIWTPLMDSYERTLSA
ncbi:3-deoxy-D-manno-octulosonic acid kinase [Dyella nitratireducens]|uniref:3-deoxy-D-manno-octulosonic acid kinase n=1 Tax=Dyella nitratireducens TaxID=1849580 RepID=A0ABQ1FKQ8_9GAMM|nr:3-deoxy-D-manno-octulosonic acid kinase [Dyella nitratireducens]GGA18272.1 3-deoxy-D-manno-octulosonic acid kinase [Dyella nitratireducens]GLQ44676.1 3-deoxy-D-manno-octulosonic acid kinase [Dyella nitratireducens]